MVDAMTGPDGAMPLEISDGEWKVYVTDDAGKDLAAAKAALRSIGDLWTPSSRASCRDTEPRMPATACRTGAPAAQPSLWART